MIEGGDYTSSMAKRDRGWRLYVEGWRLYVEGSSRGGDYTSRARRGVAIIRRGLVEALSLTFILYMFGRYVWLFPFVPCFCCNVVFVCPLCANIYCCPCFFSLVPLCYLVFSFIFYMSPHLFFFLVVLVCFFTGPLCYLVFSFIFLYVPSSVFFLAVQSFPFDTPGLQGGRAAPKKKTHGAASVFEVVGHSPRSCSHFRSKKLPIAFEKALVPCRSLMVGEKLTLWRGCKQCFQEQYMLA